MKNYILIITMFLALGVWSCKTKSIDHTKGTYSESKVVETDCLISDLERNVSTKIDSEFTKEELSQMLSQLNINFKGEQLEDKLDVLLSKSEQGTKVSFQGKGSVGYTENITNEISILRKDLFKHTDSLIQTIKLQQSQNFKQIENDWKVKNKQTESKTFTPAIWLIIGLAVIVGMFLSWISKQINLSVFRK